MYETLQPDAPDADIMTMQEAADLQQKMYRIVENIETVIFDYLMD